MRSLRGIATAAVLTGAFLTGCSASMPDPHDSTGDGAGHGDAADLSTYDAAVSEIRDSLPDEAPTAVATLSVGIAELLVALDVPPAGVPTTQLALPPGLDDVARVGNSVDPDLEALAQVAPDLILSPASIHEPLDEKLKPLGTATAAIPTDSLDDLAASTLALGDLFGVTDRAEELVRELRTAEAEAMASAVDAEGTRVLLLFGSPDDLMVMGPRTYAGEIVSRLGAVNVSAEIGLTEAYTPFSMESVVEADPDVVLVVAHGDEDDSVAAMKAFLDGQPAWKSLTAAQNDAVGVLPFDLFGIASLTRAPDAFDRMVAALS